MLNHVEKAAYIIVEKLNSLQRLLKTSANSQI